MDKHIGAQYFTIKDFIQDTENFDKACKTISEIGYTLVQISGTPLKAEEMKPILDKYNLKVVTSHRAFDDFKTDIYEIIHYNKTLGCDLCGVSIMPKYCYESKEALDQFIKDANEICKVLKENNMYFGYHNHALEFGKVDGKVIFDRLVEETDKEVFNFIVDTYWVQYGGRNPADVIENLGKRAMAIHLKDFTIDVEDWFKPCICEVGYGNLDWDTIIEASEKAGARWALVEQDNNHTDDNPFKSMKMSYDYLTTKGFC